MVPIDLSGKTAIVTGATGKLGKAIVRTLAKAGADVIIGYGRNREKAQEIRDNIISEYSVEAYIASADIKDENSIKAMADDIKANFKSPDIIVNCAVSQLDAWKPVLEESVDSYLDQFKSCVIHNVAMVKAFVPDMMEKGYGRVIGINSECSLKCTENESAYSSAKRAMDGIYRCLVKEIGYSGITVNQVAPGWILAEDERQRGNDDEKQGFYYTNKVPMRRRGSEDDIANAVLFLASDLAGFINGVYLPVCGGNVLPCI